MSTRGKLLRATLRRRKHRYYRLSNSIYTWAYYVGRMRV